MAKDPSSSDDQNSSYLNQDDSEKSLVGKFKSIISNTPLSKWFRRQENDVKSTIRRREEDYEEVNQLQPPTKKAKFAITLEDDVGVLSNKSSDSTIKDKLINRHYSFPEPVAGPSGLQSRNLLNDVNTPTNSDINVHLFGSSDFLNGHKDSDSEESTSGYSSVPRIGSKEHVCRSEESSKQHSPLQSNSPNRRSLFDTPAVGISNRTLFTTPQQNTSMSSRRPQFNSSTFGSPNFVDQTLSTEKVIRSPFYSGSTMYGGASAYGNKFGKRAKDLRGSLKQSVQIRPISKNTESGSMVLGKTARKILETLEQYSTPVNDAKKIPVASKRVRLDTSLLGKHVGVNQYIVPGESAFSKELQVPTVPDLLKMKQKLQSSTEAVRQIATSSKSDLNVVSPKQYISPQDTVNTPKLDKINTPQEKNVPVLKNQNAILQKEKNITPSKVNKLKEAVSSNTISSLPKFDLIIPPVVKVPEKLIENPVVSSPVKIPNVPQPIVIKNNSQKEEQITVTQFKFSDPLIISENLKSIVAMNNFKFSEPLSNLNKLESKNTSKQFKEKNNGQTIVENTFMDKFKPASGTWECSTCLIRNQKEQTKCVACETSKLNPVQTENKKVSSFGDKFKMPDNMWECSVCMIRNSNDRTKCLACETPNPKSSILVSSSSSFQGKFKPPADTWECSTCLIRNKNEIEKCAACETPRVSKNPSINDLATAFKKKTDEWECTVCMVRNRDTHMKCQCCEAAKPGSTKLIVQETEKKPQSKFNFGIDKASVTQFKFGIQPTSTSEVSVTKLPDPITTTSTASTFTSSIEKKVETSKTSVAVVKSAVSSSTVEKPKVTAVVPQIVLSPNNKAPSATGVLKPSFSFGLENPKSAETVVATKTAAAGKAPETAKPTATSTFKFGNSSKPVIPSKTTFEQTKTSVMSGDNGLDAKASPTFATTSKQSSELPLINKTAAKPFLFKSTDSNGNTPVEVPTFNFGQTTSPSSKPSTTQSSGFGFQNNTSKSTQSFDFGLKTNPTMTQSSGFNSGQNTATIPQSSGFNFGPTPAANVAATQSTGFNNQPVTKSLSFNFSTAKTDSENIFSRAGSGTASKNGIFNFGAANQGSSTTQKTGFNFGGAANAPAPPFNLGAATTRTQAAPSAGAGFSFTMPYDANAKPSFNFTDGPVAFSSQPSGEGGAAVPRKIKKAVRRSQR